MYIFKPTHPRRCESLSILGSLFVSTSRPLPVPSWSWRSLRLTPLLLTVSRTRPRPSKNTSKSPAVSTIPTLHPAKSPAISTIPIRKAKIARNFNKSALAISLPARIANSTKSHLQSLLRQLRYLFPVNAQETFPYQARNSQIVRAAPGRV
jgi:hypothetical protein